MKNTPHISNQRGFTLIELLIAIAVAGILAAISIMNTPQMLDNYRVRGAARQLYADMQMARLRAIKEGKDWALQYSGNTYTVRNKGSNATWGDSDDVIAKTVDLSSEYSGFGIRSSPTRNIFYSNGTAGRAGGASITVTGRKGTRTIRLTPNTGTGNIRIH